MYHVYFDQGGLLGLPKILCVEEKLPDPDEWDDRDISNYYYGHMTRFGISGIITTYNNLWGKKYPLNQTEGDLVWTNLVEQANKGM